MTPFEAVVLCGGRSRRMGQDKAFLDLGRGPLVALVAAAARRAGAVRVQLLGGDAPALEQLGLEVVPDRLPGHGPLPALAGALGRAETEIVFVASCDLVAPDPAAMAAVVGALGHDADASIPTIGGRDQYLHAAYRRSLADLLEAAAATGERRLWRALTGIRIVHPDVPASATADVDSPDDVRRWRDAAGPPSGPRPTDTLNPDHSPPIEERGCGHT
ncbi:MAG: molybdenum cofactor guanylyltransferase [Acidimicrobiales bacterium]|nr:molybdenum cofactor guanylyltransferase [Acidimicrobiales bacterium]